MRSTRQLVALGAVVAGIAAPAATASQLLDRNATGVKLETTAKGEAMVTYRAGGKLKHVLAWGAVNAIAPTRSRPQVAFKLDYAGGYGKYHTNYWQTYTGVCLAYDGPALAWKVSACKAPDGSYWALQSWQRALPDLGVTPTPAQAVWELRLSHWTGSPATLTIATDWAYRQYDHLFGSLTFGGTGVYGFRSTSSGNPLDTFGRNIYLDTFDSAYGPGWKRENSFLTHASGGTFCYGLFPHQNGGNRPAGKGTKYRATVEGPGVTPDVTWLGDAPGAYDATADQAANDRIKELNDKQCKAN
jgi:hypothetical protein